MDATDYHRDAQRNGRSAATNTLTASGAATPSQCRKATRLGSNPVLVVSCSALLGSMRNHGLSRSHLRMRGPTATIQRRLCAVGRRSTSSISASSLSAMTELGKSPMVGNRIVVTGMAGAGKSTFSRTLSTKTGLPVIHLDLHSWNPGWLRVPQGEFLEKQRVRLAGDRWIVDSNDVDDDLLVERADTLVILSTPWWICSWRAFRRGLRRPRGAQLPDGCDESLSQRLRDEWGIVWRNWRNRKTVPERDRALASHCRGFMQVHVLSSKREAADFAECI